MMHSELEYVGFWRRFVASIIDTVLLLIVTWPLLFWIYGAAYITDENISLVRGPADFLISWVLPAVAVIWFWVAQGGATPGKRAVGAMVVDAETGAPVTVGKAVIRYIGYFVSMLGLFIGFLWVGFDPKKQGWHDHMAGTVVVRKRAVVAFDRT
ncbi:RDD family protein [Lysobacter sp. A6]|uniref:RDD family protein n=1 Tax=Noviluteimonas lactosilytica TaxID=2888523 RepID=A0ABS8JE74_9GAMM|nr:RDD family protein [Lysobacter lactosilyticus]MCC8361897.1 RDD family protein [Lysobacter lactosilyticus]